MADNNRNEEKIDRYLRGEMDPNERELFEGEMERDPGLADEVDLHRDIIAGIELQYRKNLKERFKQIEGQSAKHRRLWNRQLAVAASVILAIGAGFAIYFSITGGNQDARQLYAKHFEPYPNYLAETKRGNGSFDSLQKAMFLYEQQKFDKAAVRLENLKPKDSATAEKLRFYLANAYLASNQVEKALPVLEAIVDQKKHYYHEAGQWYLGLAYLQQERKQRAKRLFKRLARHDNRYYGKQAEKLMEKW